MAATRSNLPPMATATYAEGASGRIGPNAILQYVPVLIDQLGDVRMRALLNAAGLAGLPDRSYMVDEAQVRRLHQRIRRELPQSAPALAARAGAAAAHYIVRHRIPVIVRPLLRYLPTALAERLLARAVAQHAWTFVGSGQFRQVSLKPLVFEIAHNPLVLGERSDRGVCDWHAAVFAELFERLLGQPYRARETACSACGDRVCRFEIERVR